ncbi:gliding motility-associated C-terminal domain-containing protein [Pontibacter sp. E15-1]|uniref:LamG-like jellyroll fold domain-containing protein n=1 Tax=Pontibacter sp. E15-1 TaxID=2919918 RepID=UPI001F4F177C|nr:LamG-like jellyroll fold domain-containing protein [Pontibacter sp. E15-1]MCJ8166368.1 gliding motility-associated C-terminal domain-containing protein [Pontibacter sp. E15-1]
MNKILQCGSIFILIVLQSLNTYGQGPGNALILDGNYGYVLSSTSNRGITNQVTVEAWVKTTANKYQWVAGKYDRYGAERGYHLIIKDGKAAFAGRDGSGIYRISGYSNIDVNDGQWHHLAGTCDGSTWSIYVDGILKGSIQTNYYNTSLINNAPLAIGKYFLVDDEYYVGQIDEVRIWKKALTIDEIRERMCSKLAAISSELVAYFNFDNSGTTLVQDLSSLKLNGTLQNVAPASSWKVSGAPIGDKSVYRYTNNWDASLEMVTGRANFSVHEVDPAIKGFHLYTINSPPASTKGITAPGDVKEYYGLFKVGEGSRKYKVYFKQYGLKCGSKLYRRQDNTAANWTQVADTTSSPIMLYSANENYGEFAATANNEAKLAIVAPASFCAGTAGTLRADFTGNGSLLWSNGETSATINVTQGGTYWVELTTTTGCTAREEISISFSPEPVFNFPKEVFTCDSAPVVLDATTAGASYQWSNGKNTPLITVTSPGTYSIRLTINGCAYEKEIVVSNGECLAIPNIITPNGDQKNDAFVVQGLEQNSLALKIMNRWGKPIYQKDHYDNSWSAVGMPDGMYYYQFTSSVTHRVYKGWVEVIR